MNAPGDLTNQAEDFSQFLSDTINAVLDGKHELLLTAIGDGNRYVLEPKRRTKDDQEKPWIDLWLRKGQGERIGRLLFKYTVVLDHDGKYLKVGLSYCVVQAENDKSARLRLEYDEGYLSRTQAPVAHWQIQAHHNAFANWLTRAEEGKKAGRRFGRVDKIHLPVGGERFRPCLEDVLQMLKTDFGVATKRGAQQAIEDGRERWRQIQLMAAVRDHPEIAAKALANCGYEITPKHPKEPRVAKHRHY